MNRPRHDQQLLKAAIMLKEAYSTHQSPTMSHPLPNERWQQIQRLERQVQKSVEHGYSTAAQTCRQRLSEQVRFFVQEIGQCEVQLASSSRTESQPTLRVLYEELKALSDEFVEVDIDRALKEIVVFTERIVLEGIDLGPFEIRLSIARVRETQPYRVMSIENNTEVSDDNVPHPHIQGQSLCTGDGTQAINNALSAGRLCDFFLTVRQILRTYNASSAYILLEDWNGITCGDCGDMTNSDESHTCESCHGSLCDGCSYRCEGCEETLCNECSETCEDCDNRFCRGCLQRCKTCECQTCRDCLENELCSSCLEQEMEEDDAESENTPIDQTTSPSTTEETTTQTNPSHAPVQSLCLGEVTVPA